jgi:hypothetical protein
VVHLDIHSEIATKEVAMTKEEKLDKICNDFSSLNEEKQDYILGILQALVFAKNEGEVVRVEESSKIARK